MIAVIIDSELLEDDLCHPGTGPEIALVPGLSRSLQEQSFEPEPLSRIKLWRTARCRPGFDPLGASFPMGGLPTPDTSTVYTEHPRDVDGRMPALQERDRMVAPPFEFLRTPFRSHVPSPLQENRTLLVQ
jgi:hypothetical protein